MVEKDELVQQNDQIIAGFNPLIESIQHATGQLIAQQNQDKQTIHSQQEQLTDAQQQNTTLKQQLAAAEQKLVLQDKKLEQADEDFALQDKLIGKLQHTITAAREDRVHFWNLNQQRIYKETHQSASAASTLLLLSGGKRGGSEPDSSQKRVRFDDQDSNSTADSNHGSTQSPIIL